MQNLPTIFPAFEDFFQLMKNAGIIKEFNIIPLEVSENNFPQFESLYASLKKRIDSVLVSCHKSSKCEESEDLNGKKDNIDAISNSTSLKKGLVQLEVNEEEIQRRISAFVSRKRKEVDEWNIHEFCSRPYIEEQNPAWDKIDSCARVDAVFIPRFGSKSHVKVSKVENSWGPQTRNDDSILKCIKKEPEETVSEEKESHFEAIQERLSNMESHLKLKTDSSIRNSIFQRLKQLEDRILFLEGISPDYFHLSGPNYSPPKKKMNHEKEKLYSNWNVEDLQQRIQTLKESLRSKSRTQKEISN